MWPVCDAWFTWTVLLAAVPAFAVAVWKRPMTLRRFVAAVLTGLFAWYVAAVVEDQRTAPDRYYTYIYVHPNRTALLADGSVELFRRSTGTMDKVQVCYANTAERPTTTKYPCFSNREGGRYHTFGEGTEPFAALPPGDWTLDIDPPNKLGRVIEQINVVVANGRATTAFAQARRKEGRQEILCETPKREGVSLCE
jgi:hypothetical protein